MTEEEQDPPEKLTRRERRAQAKGDDQPNAIRDRNERLRAQAAAQRRKRRSEERAEAVGEGLATAERFDDALTRSADAARKFVGSNFAWMQWLFVLGVGLGIFALVMRYRSGLEREKHGHTVAGVLATAFGKIKSEEASEARDPRLVDTRPEFDSDVDRSNQALSAWQKLRAKQSPEVQAIARLGAAHAQYDLKKYDEALEAYRALAGDKGVGATSPAVKAHALEGIGFCLEAQSKYPEALEAFKKLADLGDKPQKQLGRFHVARIHHLLHQDDEAKKILNELNTALTKDALPGEPQEYLTAAVQDLLRTVDPAFAIQERQELEKKQAEEQAKRLAEMIEQMKQRNGNFSLPGEPSMPLPTPLPLEEGAAPAPQQPPAPPQPPQAQEAPQAPVVPQSQPSPSAP